MREVVIVAAKRTAISSFMGTLSTVAAVQLGATVMRATLSDLPKPIEIDEVIFGQVIQAGEGQNPARQAAIAAGVDLKTPSFTVNMVCGSGMKSIHLAAQAIACKDAEVVIAGGQESMSMAPHLLPNSRIGKRLGHWQLQDSLLSDGLTCSISEGIHMGITAENLAQQYSISREDQDAYAVLSQEKASRAQNEGAFESEICGVEIIHPRRETIVFDQDEFIRHGLSKSDLSKLSPAFKKEGTVTAGNASGINDGAAALILMSADKAKSLGLRPLAKIVSYASTGVEPTVMGIGPVMATQRCLEKANWNIDDLDLIESNEAFSAQSIAVNQALKWNTELVNVNGGAIALGHPIGASGARIVVTLIHAMNKRNAKKGLATMCIGGGQGIATAFELIS